MVIQQFYLLHKYIRINIKDCNKLKRNINNIKKKYVLNCKNHEIKIILACALGYTHLLEKKVYYGNYCTLINENLLIIAAYFGQIHIIQFLLKYHSYIDINSCDNYGYNPFLASILSNQYNTAVFLAKHTKVNIHKTLSTNANAYYLACMHTNLKFVKYIQSLNINTNIITTKHSIPLFSAIYTNKINIVKYIANNHNTNFVDMKKYNAYLYACIYSSYDIINYLYTHFNINVTQFNDLNYNGIHYAFSRRNIKIIQLTTSHNSTNTISNLNQLIENNNYIFKKDFKYLINMKYYTNYSSFHIKHFELTDYVNTYKLKQILITDINNNVSFYPSTNKYSGGYKYILSLNKFNNKKILLI